VTARHESPDTTPATDTEPGRHEAPEPPADPKPDTTTGGPQ
jgi:hypothetical protein